MQPPKHDINAFISACRDRPETVFVIDNALKTASNEFNLRTQKAIKEFIGNNGLDSLEHQNTVPYQQDLSCTVDAYTFKSGFKSGYVALFYQPKTNKWIIKSFKRNTSSPTYNPFSILRNVIVSLEPKDGCDE